MSSRLPLGPAARWSLFAAGEVIALSFLLLPDARHHLAAYLSLFFAGSLLAIFAARSLSASTPRFLLICGAAFRLTLLFRAPDLSDDVWRYLWDARVAASGVSPWRYAPDDPALSNLAPALKARVAHREIRTVYPPAAEAVFGFVGGGGGPFLLKACFAAADLSIVAMLAGAGLPGGNFAAALYAFHPLPWTETAGEGHLDSLGVALLVASVLYAQRGRRSAAGLGLALSVLTKYVSAAAMLPILRRAGGKAAVVAVLSGAVMWVAATRGGVSPAGGLDQYATRWDFNSLAYPAVFHAMESTRLPDRAKEAFLEWKARLGHPAWTSKVFPFFYAAFFARAILGIGLAIILVAIACRSSGRDADLWVGVLASVGALLLFSPTLHPWYALWVLPFAAVRRDAAFLWLASVIPIAYCLLATPAVLAPGTVLAVEYVPLALLLAMKLFRRRPSAPILPARSA